MMISTPLPPVQPFHCNETLEEAIPSVWFEPYKFRFDGTRQEFSIKTMDLEALSETMDVVLHGSLYFVDDPDKPAYKKVEAGPCVLEENYRRYVEENLVVRPKEDNLEHILVSGEWKRGEPLRLLTEEQMKKAIDFWCNMQK